MTTQQFTAWMDGFLENSGDKGLSKKQLQTIKGKLEEVLKNDKNATIDTKHKKSFSLSC
jgi:hypothetical protein